jgi:dipeptidyl aminopeptidase/acylaminoacyl peptidase
MIRIALILAVFGSLGVCTIAAAQKTEFTPLDVARIRSVMSADVSPDGKSIAYTATSPRDPLTEPSGPASVELFVVDTATGKSRPYVSGKVSIKGVAWTPDGAGISFLAKRGDDKNTSLYVIPIDGGEAQKRVEHSTAISGYQWSPDGKQVAFLAKNPDPKSKSELVAKGFNAEGYEENLKDTLIWIASSQPGDAAKPRTLKVPGSASEIHWSPDSKQIVAAVAPTPLIDHHYMYRRIRIVDVASGKVVKKIENPGKIGEIAWSPDGTRLAFLSGEDINDPSYGRLMIASVKTGKFSDIMPKYLPNVMDIAWASNDALNFLAHDGCYSAFGIVSSDGSQQDILWPAKGTVFDSFSQADDKSRLALVGESPTHSLEVFTYALEGDGRANPRRLTDVNPWFSSRKFAKQEVIEYKARDGVTVQGILVHPLNEEKGKRYPLIIAVHGGPESHVPNGWVTRYTYPGQLGAVRGFATFYPNYRGSTGRGVAFAKSHQADYGGKEFNDVLDGIDHLVKMGLVDRKKVGVTGGSYGGFASAWCATKHSQHFAASVMFVGISNQISKSGTTDIPDEMFLVHARKRVWEDWQFFLERSPVYHVENARTPILILHGKEDTRVHPSQSMELYRNLKILNKAPVRLVFYPGEGHGNRKSAARYDYNLRLMRWMEHYLKGAGGNPPKFELDLKAPKPAKKTDEK